MKLVSGSGQSDTETNKNEKNLWTPPELIGTVSVLNQHKIKAKSIQE